MKSIKYVCPCLLGIEGLVAEDLRRMGSQNVEPSNGRVTFEGDFNILARANLWSRYAERVLILLGEFEARSFEELFQGVKNLPWEDWIGKNAAFPVKGKSLNSKLTSVPDCQSIVKKAIVERLKSKYKLTWFEETGNIYQVQFLIMKDKVSIMIDTSGPGLHKRGYRANSMQAPIKETLAAAMVNLAHVRKDSQVIDPFCGSGTILIESALYALNIAPGIRRKFMAEVWDNIPKNVWMEERERAMDLIKRENSFFAFGYDIDSSAIELANNNIRKAGVSSRIKLEQRDIKDFKSNTQNGIIICNPPYGERLLDKKRAKDLYKMIGMIFKKNSGLSCYIISPDDEFESVFGMKADKRRKLYNGMIKCQYYMYFKSK